MRSGKEIGSIVTVEKEISMIMRRKANERQKKGEGEAEEEAKAKTRRIQPDRKGKGRRGPNLY